MQAQRPCRGRLRKLRRLSSKDSTCSGVPSSSYEAMTVSSSKLVLTGNVVRKPRIGTGLPARRCRVARKPAAKAVGRRTIDSPQADSRSLIWKVARSCFVQEGVIVYQSCSNSRRGSFLMSERALEEYALTTGERSP